jgi:sec-independent protein translocase protein TatC
LRSIAIAVVIAAVLLSVWPGPSALIRHPGERRWWRTCRKGATLIATNVISPFFVPLKVLMMAAVLLALPWLMYQAWMFVAPGLYSHEKKLVRCR